MSDIDPTLAVDLGQKPAEQSDEEKELRRLSAVVQEAHTSVDAALARDRALTRMFKGIVPRSERHRMMRSAVR